MIHNSKTTHLWTCLCSGHCCIILRGPHFAAALRVKVLLNEWLPDGVGQNRVLWSQTVLRVAGVSLMKRPMFSTPVDRRKKIKNQIHILLKMSLQGEPVAGKTPLPPRLLLQWVDIFFVCAWPYRVIVVIPGCKHVWRARSTCLCRFGWLRFEGVRILLQTNLFAWKCETCRVGHLFSALQ